MNDDDLEKALDLTLMEKLRLWPALSVMKEILLRIWNDPAYATSIGRALIGLLANQIVQGAIPLPPGKTGAVLWWIATYWPVLLALPAGQTNKSEGDIKAIAIDPSIAPTPKKP